MTPFSRYYGATATSLISSRFAMLALSERGCAVRAMLEVVFDHNYTDRFRL